MPDGLSMLPRIAALCALMIAAMLGVAPAAAADPKCEPQSLATRYPSLAGKTIKVGISAADKPNSYRDPNDPSKIVGFDADYASAAFHCIGVPFEFAVAGWSGLMPALVSGQADVMWDGLYYTPERAKSVDYVLYSSAAEGIVVAKGNPRNIHALTDLCALKAVSQIGSTEIAALQHESQACLDAKKPEIGIVAAQDRPSGLRELQTGRVDAYVGSGTVATYDPALFDIAYIYNSGIKIGVGVHKGDKELERAIYDAILILQENGTAKKLYETYELPPSLSVPTEIVLQ
jgi:polar amino acid transport system substrate-binding protein